MKAKRESISFGNAKRLIAISDVHGNGHILKRLLDKLRLCGDDDVLILLGDHIEKGRNSLNTMRFIMELSNNFNVHTLMGNCDTLWQDVLLSRYGDTIVEYMLWRKKSIFSDMCIEQNIAVNADTDSDMVVERLGNEYGDIFDFLDRQPYIIDSDRYVFVHAGIRKDLLDAQDTEDCVRWNLFHENAPKFDKTVVVGHMPVMNYCAYNENILSAMPICDKKRNICSIDGGNAVMLYGQLNALIFDLATGETSVEYEDELVYRNVLGAQEESKNHFSIAWNHNEVEILSVSGNESLCKVKYTGETFPIPNEYIFRKNTRYFSCDYTNYFPRIEKGDNIAVLSEHDDKVLIKKNGVLGWAVKSILCE